MTTPLLRVAVVGATGAVGRDVLALLEARRFPLQELVPVATERSLGEVVEWLGHDVPVETAVDSLRGLDLVLVCTPPEGALEWVRQALLAEVPCIDLSGATAGREEVPLLSADMDPSPAALGAPVLASPPGSALAWARVLGPLRPMGLQRLVATAIEPVSAAGRAGIESLEAETVALFNQRELPSPTVFHQTIAFDCLPSTGPPGVEGATAIEEALVRDLPRLLGVPLPMAVTALRVPVFAGCGASLALELERPPSPSEVVDRLAKTPGVTVQASGASGPSTRDAVGEDVVFVGRVRPDPSREGGLLLWLAADPIRLAAANALRLAEARFLSA